MKIETLKQALLSLHLKAVVEILEETLQKAQTDNLSHADLLQLLASHEVAAREERRVKTRIAQAKRDIEFKVAANELVAAAEDKQYDLSKAQRKALETVADNPRVIMEGVRA